MKLTLTLLRGFTCFMLASLFAGFAFAQCTGSPNCTVKAGGGGGYKTIQACATAMANGDTCTVFAGTYTENVTVTSGGVGAYKTITANPGDAVTVNASSGSTPVFTINSHDKINGLRIQNLANPKGAACISIVGNSTDIFITSNVIYACGPYSITEPSQKNTTFVYIQNNTFSYPCSTSSNPDVCVPMQIVGDHHLIEGNDFSHSRGTAVLDGKNNVMRNNTWHDVVPGDCIPSSSGGQGSNCHMDWNYSDATAPNVAQFILLEGNTVHDMTADSQGGGAATRGGSLLQGQNCANNCFNYILRFHLVYHIGNGGITNFNYINQPPWINVKSYNNSWIDVNRFNANGTVNSYRYTSGSSDLNTIFYIVGSVTANNYSCFNDATSPSCPTMTYGNSDAFCTGTCTFYGHQYQTGTWTGDPGNILSDPSFLSYSGNNFHPSASSPVVGAGGKLTAAVGSGTSSTSLTVSDAGFFQDGWGFPAGTGLGQMTPDCLRIGASTTVCIAAGGINYSTNVITLASAVSWNDADPVYLYKSSQGAVVLGAGNPDMGALLFLSVSVSPISVQFRNIVKNTSSLGQVITLTNNSGGTITLTGETITGPNAADFSRSSDNCNSGTVANNSTCVVTITFTPTAVLATNETATLNIPYTGATGSPQTISLAGTSVAPSGVGPPVALFVKRQLQ